MKQKLTLTLYKLHQVFKMHQSFIVIIAALVVLIAVVLRISTLSSLGVDQAYLDDKSVKIQSVRFDDNAIKQIQTLRDSNVVIPGTQLPSGRQNPFSE